MKKLKGSKFHFSECESSFTGDRFRGPKLGYVIDGQVFRGTEVAMIYLRHEGCMTAEETRHFLRRLRREWESERKGGAVNA